MVCNRYDIFLVVQFLNLCYSLGVSDYRKSLDVCGY